MLYPFFFNNYKNQFPPKKWAESCKSESNLRQLKTGMVIYYSWQSTGNKNMFRAHYWKLVKSKVKWGVQGRIRNKNNYEKKFHNSAPSPIIYCRE